MNITIPIEFLKAIGEKPPAIRIYWVKWLADYTQELLDPDFVVNFHNAMYVEGKSLSLDTIKEAYEFGIPFFEDGFVFTEDKKAKKVFRKETMDSAEKIINYLNEKSNSTYTTSKANLECISARINEGFTISDFKRVIDKKCSQWMGTEQQKYLRPITLFQAKKFENYLNEPETFINNGKSNNKRNNLDKLQSASERAKQFFK
jgi:uncharacterized phage protein (TIGR02220 family)